LVVYLPQEFSDTAMPLNVGPVAARTFDYIVVGAGASGCATAASLARTFRDKSVALIDAGPVGDSVFVQCPAFAPALQSGAVKRFSWAHKSTAQAECKGRSLLLPSGCGLGGNTLINDNIYLRGQESDYEAWGERWAYADVLETFKKLENNVRGGKDATNHGAAGPRRVAESPASLRNGRLAGSFTRSCVAAKLPPLPSLNGWYSNDGHAPLQQMTRNGHRHDAYSAFVAPLLEGTTTPNLHVMSNTYALKLDFDAPAAGGKALPRVAGVSVARRTDAGVVAEQSTQLAAAQEVVVCLGAYMSPALLLRSGVGGRDQLMHHGVPVVAVNEGVGENLLDQPTVSLVASHLDRSPTRSFLCPDGLLKLRKSFAEWRRDRSGILTTNIDVAAQMRQTTTAAAVEMRLELLLAHTDPAAFRPSIWRDGYTIRCRALRPASRGAVSLKSKSLTEAPLIDPALLEDPADVDCLCNAMMWAQTLGNPELGLVSDVDMGPRGWTHPFNVRRVTVEAPSRNEFLELDQQRAYVAAHAQGGLQAAGTCAIGAVVDQELRCRGVRGLRVAGSAAIPTPTNGDVSIVAQAVGARCAEFIAADNGVAPAAWEY
jgi:choline dehydrogenase-like flavoprotein